MTFYSFWFDRFVWRFGFALVAGGVVVFALKLAAPPSPEDIERNYISFVHEQVAPLATRDGFTHTSGGCEQTQSDLLCVECYRPGGEAWVLCSRWGCEMLETNDTLRAAGAVPGACESANGLAVAFNRGSWK